MSGEGTDCEIEKIGRAWEKEAIVPLFAFPPLSGASLISRPLYHMRLSHRLKETGVVDGGVKQSKLATISRPRSSCLYSEWIHVRGKFSQLLTYDNRRRKKRKHAREMMKRDFSLFPYSSYSISSVSFFENPVETYAEERENLLASRKSCLFPFKCYKHQMIN